MEYLKVEVGTKHKTDGVFLSIDGNIFRVHNPNEKLGMLLNSNHPVAILRKKDLINGKAIIGYLEKYYEPRKKVKVRTSEIVDGKHSSITLNIDDIILWGYVDRPSL